MTILNLLNAITLDQRLLIIIICLAAVVLATGIVVIACVAHARKKRKENAISITNEQVAEEKTVEQTIIEEKVEEPVSDIAKDAVEENPAENPVDETDDEEKLTEAELDELVTAEEDGTADIDEEVSVRLADDTNGGNNDIVLRRIVYNRSFLARLTQATDEVKARYSVLKNYILTYAKVKPALSWRRESFRIGRSTFACFVMRGKKLCLRFATDPKRFDDTKYKVIDLSIRSPKAKQPCMYRITSDRRVKYAKEIIDMLLAELSVEKLAEHAEQDYTMPYRETDALIQDGLIKVKVIEGVDHTATSIDNVEQLKNIVKQTQQLPKRDFKILPKVEATEVNVMSDIQAEKIIEYKVVKRKKSKGAKGIINIDVLAKKFPAGSLITIDTLHEMRVIPNNVNYIKVLAKGVLDKPLIVEADDFSLQAVKMIALTGGRVIRTSDK